MLALTLLTAAWGQGCPERIAPEELRSRLQALEPDVFYAVEGAQDELLALEGLLDGCVDGPVTPDTLTRLWITVGVAEHYFKGEIGPEGELHLGSAFGLGGPDAWPQDFGTELQPRFLSAATVVVGGATIGLDFTAQDIVFVDGEIRYERGDFATTPGLHVVQWQEAGVWRGTRLRLERGETARVQPTPVIDDKPAPPPPPPPPRRELSLSVRALAGAGLATGEITEAQLDPEVPPYATSGSLGAPLLIARLQLGRGAWWGGLDLLGAPTPASDTPSWPSAAGLLGGARLELGANQLQVGLGPVLTARPGVDALVLPELPLPAGWEPDPPIFTYTLAAGGRLVASLGRSARRLQPALRLSVDVTPGLMLVPGLEPSLSYPLTERIRLDAALQASLLTSDQARLLRGGLLVGVQWGR
ncbi:MAG: hypothetical protein H6740_14395 [Alphaproteobacteria bacterium]|nr:hypothetical protein [Alphaproteobacteria bacterium]